MNIQPQEHKKSKLIGSNYPNIASTASSGECTGMMHTPPQTDDEFEAYQELFDMEIPKIEE